MARNLFIIHPGIFHPSPQALVPFSREEEKSVTLKSSPTKEVAVENKRRRGNQNQFME